MQLDDKIKIAANFYYSLTPEVYIYGFYFLLFAASLSWGPYILFYMSSYTTLLYKVMVGWQWQPPSPSNNISNGTWWV